MHLLVLDDEERIASFIVAVARGAGWSAEAATEEISFQAMFRRCLPDLVMLDLQLGISDGVEQLRFLQREDYRGDIVLVSGFDRRVLTATEQLGTSLGLVIAGVLEKPARASEVRTFLRDTTRHAGVPGSVDVPQRSAAKSSAHLSAADVGRALSDGEMRLFLQPVVTAGTGDVIKFEALIRWPHPELGMLLPERFIPLAELDDAVIDQLTMWVVREAIAHQSHFHNGHAGLPIAINISSANLRRLDFPDRVATLVIENGSQAASLAFEVTETVAMKDPHATVDILTRLRLKGFRLAIDDFGTGYSSLKTLREMPFSELKIDKSFVLDLADSPDAYAIVKSVIELARNLGLESVAEGVETAVLARVLATLGVPSLQGYYFARPMPLEQTIDWVNSRDHSRAPVN
ncbi:MAG: EAL domain-containing protein [Alphaproteobacteria bacterium]